MFGAAPELDVAFESEEDPEAARNFMDLLAASEGDGAGSLQQGPGTFRPAPDTHPAFFANSPEPGQLRSCNPFLFVRVGSCAACPQHPS